MYDIRPIPQRAFQPPKVSLTPRSPEITATRPAAVFNQALKPGTFSSMTPLTAGFLGPQQGGASRPGLSISQTTSVMKIFPILRRSTAATAVVADLAKLIRRGDRFRGKGNTADSNSYIFLNIQIGAFTNDVSDAVITVPI